MLQQGITTYNQDYRTQDQLHNQLHQSTTCTSSYTISYINLQHVQSATQSIKQVYNMYTSYTTGLLSLNTLHSHYEVITSLTQQDTPIQKQFMHDYISMQQYRPVQAGIT